MEFMDFIDDYCKEFDYQWAFTSTESQKISEMFDDGMSAAITAVLWVRYDDVFLSTLEPWIAAWFDRKRAREIQEQEVINGYEF